MALTPYDIRKKETALVTLQEAPAKDVELILRKNKRFRKIFGMSRQEYKQLIRDLKNPDSEHHKEARLFIGGAATEDRVGKHNPKKLKFGTKHLRDFAEEDGKAGLSDKIKETGKNLRNGKVFRILFKDAAEVYALTTSRMRMTVGERQALLANIVAVSLVGTFMINADPAQAAIEPTSNTPVSSKEIKQEIKQEAVLAPKYFDLSALNPRKIAVPNLRGNFQVSLKPKTQKAVSKASKYPSTFKDVARYVIKGLEGDDKIAPEPGGAIAKFGINSHAYPNVDVRNLTREAAYKIAKTKYWDKIKGDSLPEHMRLLAFDTAFNHGSGTARKFLKQAGNDPKKLLDIRHKEYIRLATVNPKKYGDYLKGWKARLDKVGKKANITVSYTRNTAGLTLSPKS